MDCGFQEMKAHEILTRAFCLKGENGLQRGLSVVKVLAAKCGDLSSDPQNAFKTPGGDGTCL